MLMPGALPANMPTAASMHQALESQKDTTLTKIFVGGLPYHTTDKSLREHFEVYGDIEEAVVITDRQTGKSRGYGFVTMADKVGAERAIKEPNPVIDGRKANVNLAYLGAKPRGPAAGEDQIYGIPLTSMRYPTMLPGQYSWAYPNNLRTSYYARAAALCGQPTEGTENMHPNYQIYQPSYLPTAAGLLPMTHSHLNPTAAALSAAASQQQAYFDYTNAATAASYPQSAAYQTAAAANAAMEPYTAISAASVMSQYGSMPGYTWAMPPAAAATAAAAAAAGTLPISPYQPTQTQLQEARMQ